MYMHCAMGLYAPQPVAPGDMPHDADAPTPAAKRDRKQQHMIVIDITGGADADDVDAPVGDTGPYDTAAVVICV